MEAALQALNQQAQELLDHGKPGKAIALLLKAQGMTAEWSTDCKPLRAQTSKYLGLAYKAKEQWSKSIDCFNTALQNHAGEPGEQAWLHLNIAAGYCTLSQHRQAYVHNSSACSLLTSLKHSQSSASMLALALHRSAEELRHLGEPKEALKTLRQGVEVMCPLLGRSHQLVHMLQDAQVKPILRRVLLSNKPVPKPARSTANSLSAQRTRQIYMQDIARHVSIIKQKPRGRSRMDEVRRSLKLKIVKNSTQRHTDQLSSSPRRRLFRPSATQSPPKRAHLESVAQKMIQIEEKFERTDT
jgi:tetratricopeptide (TPR) repeat protein